MGARFTIITAALVHFAVCHVAVADDFVKTGRSLDVAIDGRGYFRIRNLLTEEFRYTKIGRLTIGSDGTLLIDDGSGLWFVDPAITLPAEWRSIRISPNGDVSEDSTQPPTVIGSISIAIFTGDDFLIDDGNGYFLETELSGVPTLVMPGDDGGGQLLQGQLLRQSRNTESDRESEKHWRLHVALLVIALALLVSITMNFVLGCRLCRTVRLKL